MILIDAEEAKEILKHLLYETAMNNSGGASLICEDIAEYRLDTWFELVPTVDAEPVRHGRWVHRYGDEHIELALLGGECSVCGFVSTAMPYCPKCGANMDEVKDEID